MWTCSPLCASPGSWVHLSLARSYPPGTAGEAEHVLGWSGQAEVSPSPSLWASGWMCAARLPQRGDRHFPTSARSAQGGGEALKKSIAARQHAAAGPTWCSPRLLCWFCVSRWTADQLCLDNDQYHFINVSWLTVSGLPHSPGSESAFRQCNLWSKVVCSFPPSRVGTSSTP